MRVHRNLDDRTHFNGINQHSFCRFSLLLMQLCAFTFLPSTAAQTASDDTSEVFPAESSSTACRPTFVLTTNGIETSGLLERQSVIGSINDCIKLCRGHDSCTAATLDDSGECVLWADYSMAEPDANLVDADEKAAMYYAYSTCLDIDADTCSDAEWTFQHYASVAVDSRHLDAFVAQSIGMQTIEACLALCADDCRAVQYDSESGECAVLIAGPNSVRHAHRHFTQAAPNMNIYENACADAGGLVDRKCDFIPMKGAGMTDVWDERLDDIADIDACKLQCLQFAYPMCRSFTYDSTRRLCYLSHTSARTMRSSLADLRLDNTVTLTDLDDCVDFSLSCQRDSMTIGGRSTRLLDATLSPRADLRGECALTVDRGYKFEARIPYTACGTVKKMSKELATFNNVLLLKDAATELITIRDKMVNVLCKINVLLDTHLTYGFDVSGNGTEYPLGPSNTPFIVDPNHPGLPKQVTPRYSLQVLDEDGHFTDEVRIGDVGYLYVVSVLDANQGLPNGWPIWPDFEVSEVQMEADDGQPISQLYDEHGCPVDENYQEPMRQFADGSVRARIKFNEKMPFKKRVVFTGMVKPCAGQCKSPCLLSSKDIRQKRVKRESLQPVMKHQMQFQPPERSFYLSQEMYSVSKRVGVGHEDARSSTPALDTKRYLPVGIPNITEYGIPSPDNRVVRLPQLLSLLNPAARNRAGNAHSQTDDQSTKPFQSRQVRSGPVTQCITTGRLNCAITVVLSVLQVVLVGLCAALLYLFVAHYRRQRALRNRMAGQHLSGTSGYILPMPPPPDYETAVKRQTPSINDNVVAADESSNNSVSTETTESSLSQGQTE